MGMEQIRTGDPTVPNWDRYYLTFYPGKANGVLARISEHLRGFLARFLWLVTGLDCTYRGLLSQGIMLYI